MKEISIWKDTVEKKQYSKLDKDKIVNVLIIGGGITGISALYHLRNSNLKVMLVEQNKIGCSVTGNSTGKLTYLQNDLIDKIRKNFGDDKAFKYINSQIEAIQLVKSIIFHEKIDCDLEKVDSIIYTNQDSEVSKLKDLELFLKDNGIRIIKKTCDMVESKYMFGVEDTYMFHPIKFIYGLLEKDNYSIYENTSIKKIDKDNEFYLCYTDQYKIQAKWVIVATHYPYFHLPFLFPIKCSLEKSYLSASKYQGKSLSLISYGTPFISMRSYKKYLVYLSNSHSVHSDTDDSKHYEELLKKISDLHLEADYLWSNIDIMTNDGLPYIGEIQDRMLLGTGYNTWGLANGVMAGKMLSNMILGLKNEYDELFSPKRINMAQVTEGFVDGVNAISGFIKGYLEKRDNITYTKINGKDVMIYKDKDGDHMVYQHCPHVGCKLIFNELEKTWDCPCHGSRFDIDGKVISGPSNEDITLKNEE